MMNLNISIVEEMLEGKISKNPNRFEGANGIVFSVNNWFELMKEPMREYFNASGIECHMLVNGIFYTETIMSHAEFEQLDYVMNSIQLA